VPRRLTWVDPLAGELEGFPFERIAEAIRRADGGYWNSGGGGGLLYYGPVEDDRAIEVYLVPGDGFHLVYAGPDVSEPLAATRGAAPPGPARATINVGGDPRAVSRRQCLPPAEAEAVLRHFARTGRRSADVAWLPQE